MATVQLPLGLTVACSCLFIPTSAILLGMRFYTRRVQRVDIGADDWIMIPAFLCVLGMQIAMIAEVAKHMIGYADPNFKPGVADASTNLAFWPFELLQVPALGLVKISVVLFYRRIFNTGATIWQYWTIMTMIVILSAWTVGYFFAFLFICKGTPENYWKSAALEKANCVATQELHLSLSISDLILDCLVLLMVLPMIWNLQMSVTRKLAVTGVFGLGLITIAASVTRMAVFVQATALRYDPYLDFEYLDTSAMYWSMLEVGLAFLTANIVVAYRVMVYNSIGRRIRSLRSLMSRNFNRVGSDRDGHSLEDIESNSPNKTNKTNGVHVTKEVRVTRQSTSHEEQYQPHAL